MSGTMMDGLLSTMPACEYNIACVCCSGKSGIIHMIPIFNNNDIECFKQIFLFHTVKTSIFCATYMYSAEREESTFLSFSVFSSFHRTIRYG